MTNEEKIQELLNEPCWESKPYLIGMDKIGVEDVMERFAEWKDEQHAKKIKKIKRDIVLSSDRKGGYEQNRVVEVDWVLRLIDEIMKGE